MEDSLGSSQQNMDADFVSRQFVDIYYSILSDRPTELYRFYKEESQSSFADGPGETTIVLNGGREIQDNPRSNFVAARFEFGTIDSQWSNDGALLIIICGRVLGSNEQRQARPFVHTFLLSPQTNGWYVRNDIFRFTDPKKEEREAPDQLAVMPHVAGLPARNVLPEPPEATSTDDDRDMESDITVGTDTLVLASAVESQSVEITAGQEGEDAGDNNRDQLETAIAPSQESGQVRDRPAQISAASGATVSTDAAQERTTAPKEETGKSTTDSSTAGVEMNRAKVSYASIVAKTRTTPTSDVARNSPSSSQWVDRQDRSTPRQQPDAETHVGATSKEAEQHHAQAPAAGTRRPGVYLHQLPSGRGIDVDTLSKDLESVFMKFGKIVNLDVRLNRGFGFVDFEDEASVARALEAWSHGPPAGVTESLSRIKVQARRDPASRTRARTNNDRGATSSRTMRQKQNAHRTNTRR